MFASVSLLTGYKFKLLPLCIRLLIEAEDSDSQDSGEPKELEGLWLTLSEVYKTPWQVKISKTLLKETGYSQSQSRASKISSSASISLYDLLFVSISRLRQLFYVLLGNRFINFVEWAIWVSISQFFADINRQASALIINLSISSIPF